MIAFTGGKVRTIDCTFLFFFFIEQLWQETLMPPVAYKCKNKNTLQDPAMIRAILEMAQFIMQYHRQAD